MGVSGVRGCALRFWGVFARQYEVIPLSQHFFGANFRLILRNKTADSGYFSHTRHSLQLITQMPVLQSAQVSEAVFVAAVYDRVFVNPPGTGGIGPDCGVDSFGQTAGDLLHVFEDS